MRVGSAGGWPGNGEDVGWGCWVCDSTYLTALADSLRLFLSSPLIFIRPPRPIRLSYGRRYLLLPEMSSQSAELIPPI